MKISAVKVDATYAMATTTATASIIETMHVVNSVRAQRKNKFIPATMYFLGSPKTTKTRIAITRYLSTRVVVER
jgi:hypothetical protein